MAKIVGVDNLALAVMAELNAYSEEVADVVKESAKQTAEECKKEIKEKAPKKDGKYKRGWCAEVAYENRSIVRVVVHNKTKPSITHLLEYGHAKRGGGRVEGKAHIKPAEQKAAKRFEEAIKEALT